MLFYYDLVAIANLFQFNASRQLSEGYCAELGGFQVNLSKILLIIK